MQPVVPTRPSPARRRTSSFRFIMPLTGYWFLSLINITVSRAGSDTVIVTVLVKLDIGLPLASRNNRDRARAGGQPRHSETQELRQIVPGARVGRRRGRRGKNFADDSGGKEADPHFVRGAVM